MEGASVVVGLWVVTGDCRTLVMKRELDDTMLETTELAGVAEGEGSTDTAMEEDTEEVTATDGTEVVKVGDDVADWTGTEPAPTTGALDPVGAEIGVALPMKMFVSDQT
jgi:hypothetical protein